MRAAVRWGSSSSLARQKEVEFPPHAAQIFLGGRYDATNQMRSFTTHV